MNGPRRLARRAHTAFRVAHHCGYSAATVPRRVLLLITDLQIGGTPTVVRDLALRLQATGAMHVEVACLAPWGPVADQLEHAGITVSALNARRISSVGVIRRCVKLIRAHAIDTVFSFLIHANTVAAIASYFERGLRVIQAIQTTQPRPRWHWRLQGLIQNAAEAIVVPSPSVAAAAVAWSAIPESRITAIPNAIDPDDFARSSIPRQDPRPYPIGFIGRLDPIKRVPMLVAAMTTLRDVAHLHVFGDGPERQTIIAEIDRVGADQLVSMEGPVMRPQDALARIGALVLPSRAEGFGLVLIEAMAACVPVIATDAPGIRDVVQDGVNGLLTDPDDPADLGDAIRDVIEDPALRHRLAAGGLRTVRERYTWQQVLPSYLQLLA